MSEILTVSGKEGSNCIRRVSMFYSLPTPNRADAIKTQYFRGLWRNSSRRDYWAEIRPNRPILIRYRVYFPFLRFGGARFQTHLTLGRYVSRYTGGAIYRPGDPSVFKRRRVYTAIRSVELRFFGRAGVVKWTKSFSRKADSSRPYPRNIPHFDEILLAPATTPAREIRPHLRLVTDDFRVWRPFLFSVGIWVVSTWKARY